MAELDARRAKVLGTAAESVQRRIRSYIARKRFVAMKKASIQVQSIWKSTNILCTMQSEIICGNMLTNVFTNDTIVVLGQSVSFPIC